MGSYEEFDAVTHLVEQGVDVHVDRTYRLEEYVDALARLDARYAGREGDVPAEEWATYVAERARLKRELEAHLAGGGGST